LGNSLDQGVSVVAEEKGNQASTSGSEEGSSGEAREHAADLVREALAHTWWGTQPWRRYVRLLALIGPALVIERVAAVTNFSRANAWPILVALDLGNWLQIITGSFIAWFPWSLACIATVMAAVGTWTAFQAGYAGTIVELEHGRPVMVATYGQVGSMVAAMLVPVVAAAALVGPLPSPLWALPAIAAAGAWFLVSESLPDEYRMAKIEFVRRSFDEGGPVYLGELFQAIAAGLHVRVPLKWRSVLASLLIPVAFIGVIFGLWRMLTDRTPWVPQECIAYGPKGQESAFKGYLLVEGDHTDTVLRASDRVVLSLPAALVSRNAKC
jgi:hypothetical protein